MNKEDKSKKENIKEAIKFLKDKDVILKEERVENFLSNNLEIVEVLYEFLEVVDNYFSNYKLSIEIEKDRYENQLFLIILVGNGEVEKYISQLENLEDDWLVPVIKKGIYNLNISLGFK